MQRQAVRSLATCGPAGVDHAQGQLRRLAAIARSLQPQLHPGAPHDASCPLATHPHGARLCRLVPSLAALDVDTGDATPIATPDTLARAILRAADAVRWCRQTAHPGGSCWFRSGRGGGCGEVLQLGYLLDQRAA